MFRKRRKTGFVISLALVSSLTVGAIPLNSLAANEDEPLKEEVVYGIMNSYGDVDNIYVVNAFDVLDSTVVEDYGEYNNVKNLTDLEPVQYNDNLVSVSRDKGRFYYQGDLVKKDLPWNVNITYILDGREENADDIRGKDGKLEMVIEITQNENIDPMYFEKYMVQLSITLDTEKCKHIKAKGAAIASAGTDKMINFATMPETESTFTITADVKNFSMKDITLAGVPFSMSEDMIDMSMIDEMASGLDELAAGVNELDSGAGQLDKGIEEFSKGSKELAEGFKTFNSGMDQLLDGSAQLTDGAGQLKDGSKGFKDGLDLLAGSSTELENGSAKINDALTTLKDKKNELAGNIDEEQLEEIRTLMNKAYDVLVFLQGELQNILDHMENHKIEIPKLSYTKEEIIAALEELKPLVDEGTVSPKTYAVFEDMYCNIDISNIIEKIVNSKTEIKSFIEKIKGDLDHIIEVIVSIDIPTPEEIEKLLGIIDEFADQYGTFHNQGIVQFMEGIRSAAGGYNELDKGIEGLYTGASGLYGGIKMTKEGSGQLLDGVIGLADGAYSLSGGMTALADGISVLNKNTSAIPSAVQEGLDELLGKFTDTDIEPVSFVSQYNENVEAVQFVMVVKGIEPVEEQEIPEVKEEDKSIWQKILDLFR